MFCLNGCDRRRGRSSSRRKKTTAAARVCGFAFLDGLVVHESKHTDYTSGGRVRPGRLIGRRGLLLLYRNGNWGGEAWEEGEISLSVLNMTKSTIWWEKLSWLPHLSILGDFYNNDKNIWFFMWNRLVVHKCQSWIVCILQKKYSLLTNGSEMGGYCIESVSEYRYSGLLTWHQR